MRSDSNDRPVFEGHKELKTLDVGLIRAGEYALAGLVGGERFDYAGLDYVARVKDPEFRVVEHENITGEITHIRLIRALGYVANSSGLDSLEDKISGRKRTANRLIDELERKSQSKK